MSKGEEFCCLVKRKGRGRGERGCIGRPADFNHTVCFLGLKISFVHTHRCLAFLGRRRFDTIGEEIVVFVLQPCIYQPI